MLKFLVGCVMVASLVGCASRVKLDSVPVEDRKPTVVTPQTPAMGNLSTPGASAGGTTVAKSAVTPIDISRPTPPAAGPSGAKLVYFDYDSFVIKPEFQGLIESHAAFLNADRGRKMVIEGHTDERGGREYNLALGQKRSEAVRRALGLLGVTEAQVEAVSFGKEKPAVAGSDEAAMAKNRRAELTYR